MSIPTSLKTKLTTIAIALGSGVVTWAGNATYTHLIREHDRLQELTVEVVRLTEKVSALVDRIDRHEATCVISK